MNFIADFKRFFGKVPDALFALALTDATTFHGTVRPILNGHSGGDIVKAQALVLDGIRDYLHVVRKHSDRFLVQVNRKTPLESVMIPLAGRQTTPVGAGVGLDPNAEGLEVLSHLFGYQVPGPVSVHSRHLESAPFQDDSRRDDLYVPPTFASKGLVEFVGNVKQYRRAGGEAILLPAICTVPDADNNPDTLLDQLRTLIEALRDYVDGFVWTPSLIPENRDLPHNIRHLAAALMTDLAGDRLKLIEMAPYEPSQRAHWLDSVKAFLDGGGDGIVAVSGLPVPCSRVPKPDRWPFDSAILCGASMRDYRQRAIEDARRCFPSAFIAACGGFHEGSEAFRALKFANVIMENEAFTRFGPAMARSLLSRLVGRLDYLKRTGTTDAENLVEYQQSEWF